MRNPTFSQINAVLATDHDFYCLGCERPFTNDKDLACHEPCVAPWLERPHATDATPAEAEQTPKVYAAVR